MIGLLLLGHAAQDLYREADEQVAGVVASVLASRVLSLRLEAEIQTIRGQLEVLQAPSLPVLRSAQTLAVTAHLGEALQSFGSDIRELIPHDRIRYLLRLSETEVVEQNPEALRPIADLPVQEIRTLPSRPVLDGDQTWILAHRRNQAQLAVNLRVAGRVIGAMVIESAAGFESPRESAAIAEQFAAVVAPHLELLRRASSPRASGIPA